MLGSFQEPGKWFIRLVEANEQNLLHPRNLRTKEEIERKTSEGMMGGREKSLVLAPNPETTLSVLAVALGTHFTLLV